jgi:methionyl aminopeptidase
MFEGRSKITYKSLEEIDRIRESADILGKVHGLISKEIKVGVRLSKLDNLALEFIRDNKGVPSFLNYKGFPSTLCISVNDAVVHGIPNEYELRDGDIVSVDCGVFLNGYHADSAYTYQVGNVNESIKKLLKATYESLYLGIQNAKSGSRIGDISFAIQNYVEKMGYSVVRELVGHGLGKELHEEPAIPNFGQRGKGLKLMDGMVLAIEPMINLGKKEICLLEDGWTIKTVDGECSAHFEHTVAVISGKPEILTTFKYIKEEQRIL